jgi:hypothetical protein
MGPLRAIETEDLDDVAKFLFRVHKAAGAAPFVDTRMLEWKYLSPRSDWKGSRGFLLEKDGHIVAYGGLVPALFRLPSGDAVESAAVVDWAAERSVPGAGVILIRKLLDKVSTIFVVAGTPPARQVLPKIGFRHAGVALAYARWVRPWREFQVRPKTFRSVLRLSHGLAHSVRPRRTFVKDWDSIPVNNFDSSLQTLLNKRSSSLTFCQRTVENLNYMLQCPAIKMKGFLLRRKESVVGYFILGQIGWEGRIVDIFVDSELPQDQKAAYATATGAAMCEPDVCRIFAWAAPPLSGALVQNGFWLQDEKPVMICDPRNLLTEAFPIDLQLFEGDNAYLTDGHVQDSRH